MAKRRRRLGSPPEVHLKRAVTAARMLNRQVKQTKALAKAGHCRVALSRLMDAAYEYGIVNSEQGASTNRRSGGAGSRKKLNAARRMYENACIKTRH